MKLLSVNSLGGFKGGIEKFVHVTAGLLEREGHQVFGLFEHQFEPEPLFASAFEEIYALNGKPPAEVIRTLADAGCAVALLHRVRSLELLEAVQGAFPTVLFVHDHDYYCMRRHKYLPVIHTNCRLPFSLAGCTLCSGMLERNETGMLMHLFNPLTRLNILRAVRRCDRVIVLSEFMRRNLIRNGFAPERVVRIHPPVTPAQTPPPFPGERNLLFAGPLVEGKGVAVLLRAMALVKNLCTLRIVGSGRDKTRLIRLVLELNLADKVEFMEYVDDLSMEYRRADLVIVPSLWQEPFGMVGIEAFCHARPVIACDQGGIGEWLRDGENGLSVASGRPEELAAKIDDLLSRPEEAEAMGLRGWEMVRREFTPELFVERLNKVLEELVGHV